MKEPKQKGHKPTRASSVDNFTLMAIRRRIQKFYTDKELFTLDSLHGALKDELGEDYKTGRTTLHTILKKLGYRYKLLIIDHVALAKQGDYRLGSVCPSVRPVCPSIRPSVCPWSHTGGQCGAGGCYNCTDAGDGL